MAEVVTAVVAEFGYGDEVAKGMRNRVRANLVYLTKHQGMVLKDGYRETARWQLA